MIKISIFSQFDEEKIDKAIQLGLEEELFRTAQFLSRKHLKKAPEDWGDLRVEALENFDLKVELMTHAYGFLYYSLENGGEVDLSPLIEDLITFKVRLV